MQVLRDAARKELERLDSDGTLSAAADHVIDLDSDSSACPACGAAIPRGSRRCPDCLLRLG